MSLMILIVVLTQGYVLKLHHEITCIGIRLLPKLNP